MRALETEPEMQGRGYEGHRKALRLRSASVIHPGRELTGHRPWRGAGTSYMHRIHTRTAVIMSVTKVGRDNTITDNRKHTGRGNRKQ